MAERREVVVVGGGPAGSTVALGLAQRGHDVVLLDEARFPRDKICGEAISPGAWRLLEELGAAPAINAAGVHPLAGMKLVAPGGRVARGRYEGGRARGFSIERRVLDAVLLARARAAGVEVREGEAVSDLLLEAGGVRGVALRGDGGPRTIAAQLVIAADGRRSRVARGLGFLHEAEWPRRFAVRGHWDGMAALENFGEMHVGSRTYCGVAPLPAGRANVTFVVDQSDMIAAGGDLPSFYHRHLERWPELMARLAGARLLEHPQAIGPLALRASRVCAPGVLLVGDAAGFFDPFTGEGIALALRSALLAAAVAHEALTTGAPLSAYAAGHQRLVREKFRFNRLVQWLVAREWAANGAARLLAAWPALADRAVGLAGDCLPPRVPDGAETPAYSKMTAP